MKFAWDPSKSGKNRLERGLGINYAALIFLAGAIENPERRKSYGKEPRNWNRPAAWVFPRCAGAGRQRVQNNYA